MAEVIVTMRHCRAAFGCRQGIGRTVQAWMRRHGLDYAVFCRDGYPAETLLATGCALARRAVEEAENAGQ